MRRRTTINDIALRAGVSIGTVSNVLNGKGQHADSTRERVLQAAAELNFTPNALIRSLQSGKTRIVGVFTWRVNVNTSRSIVMRLLEGLSEGIAAIHHDIHLYSRHPHEEEATPSFFLDGRVDGVILVPGGLNSEGLAELAAAGLPTVALYQHPVPEGMGSVNIDNVAGILEAMDHLVALGHRKMAVCAPDYSYDYSQRLAGYCQGLEKHGLPFDPALRIVTGSLTELNPQAVVNRLLSLPDPPTAVIAGDDAIAIRLLDALNERGIRVPQDISVVGFDDAPDAAALSSLTTIRQPAEEVGRQAARFIGRLIEGQPAATCRTVLPVEMIVRGTTAPPRRD